MSKTLTVVGLFLTILGASLLFFYGLPRKKVGNVIISGETAVKFEPGLGDRDVPDSEWKQIATQFQARAKRLNSTGFALVAIGTLLQMIGLYTE